MNLNLKAESDNEIAIKAYLEENASEALAEKINSGKKTMADCIGYIREQARKRAKNGMAMIKDVEVFGWAIHYFEEDSLKHEPTKEEIKAEKEAAEKREFDSKTMARTLDKPKKDYLTIEQKVKKAKEIDGQLDMFSLMGGM